MDFEPVLNFWFGPEADDEFAQDGYSARWYQKDPNFDQEIRRKFGNLIERAEAHELESWKRNPRSLLALIILLDQFTRNIYRNSPRSWSSDNYAQGLTKYGINQGLDHELRTYERHFLYMPFMHAEDLALQNEGCEKFKQLISDARPRAKEFHEGALPFAYAHRDIIEKFGRFPHRNKVLGRPSTPEEIEFLKQPNSSF